MITFNAQLAIEIMHTAMADHDRILGVLDAVINLDAETRSVLLYDDYDMRSFEKYPAVKRRLLDAAQHAAWSKFFASYELYSALGDSDYRKATRDYLFTNPSRREAANKDGLVTFTPDEARRFFDAHIADTTKRRHADNDALLDACGADWKKRPAKYSASMTLRNMDAWCGNSVHLGRVVRQACWIMGVEFSYTKYWTEVRNNRTVDGVPFELQHGLDMTIELRQNGNATLRMSKDVAAALNQFVGFVGK